MCVLIVRDRASSGGGIHNYYQAVTPYLKTPHRCVDVGRPHRYYTPGGVRWFVRVPTAIRLVWDWLCFCIHLVRSRGMVHLNPCMDPPDFRSLRRDAVNLLIAKIFRRRVLVFWRGWDNDTCGTEQFPQGNGGWLSRMYRRADAHIVLSSAFRDDLLRWGFRCPIFVETTVVSDLLTSHDPGTRHREESAVFRLLFLSRVEVAKGVLELIDAFALLRIREPGRYHLTIAGDGPDLILLRTRALQLGLTEITFEGHVEGRRKLDCYVAADAFCFLSYTEGMPNAVLEAMAMGLPLVSSAAGGLRDILEDGVCGYLLECDRKRDVGHRFPAEEVAATIERLALDPESRQRMSRHNRTFARERFSAPTVAGRLDLIYQSMISLNGTKSVPSTETCNPVVPTE